MKRLRRDRRDEWCESGLTVCAMSPSDFYEGGPLLNVLVDNPVQEGMGPYKHTIYRITTTFRSGGSTSASCRHRFSEFVSLREELITLNPGVVIPPLPEKKVINRFATEFVEERREMLEIFLEQTMAHPIASTCSKIHSFLQLPEPMKTAVTGRAQSFQLPVAHMNETGDPLEHSAKLLAEFESQLNGVRDRFKRLQSRQSEDAMDLHELSQGIQAMAENKMNMVLACALGPYTEGLQALASATKKQAMGTKQTLLPKLKHYKMIAVAMQEQFKRREALNSQIDALGARVKDVLGQSTKLAGKSGKERKVGELEHQASELKARIETMRETYKLFTRTLTWELDRYNQTKNRDVLSALQDHALGYTEYTAKEHELWGGISAGVISMVRKVTSEAANLRGLDEVVSRPRGVSSSSDVPAAAASSDAAAPVDYGTNYTDGAPPDSPSAAGSAPAAPAGGQVRQSSFAPTDSAPAPFNPFQQPPPSVGGWNS